MISPAFAAPAISPVLHEQAMRRLKEATGFIPVEYPTTRQLGASAEARAADVNAVFADRSIRAVLAAIGGDDQITVIPHFDAAVIAANPKPFLGYSDNTNLHNLLWNLGVRSFYGGSGRPRLPVHGEVARAEQSGEPRPTLTSRSPVRITEA
ncbi:LD-carboxypeptidase [Microbacterium schleiferi]|uniref:LD-carboxypeptidase n=1 Tax=Microbacterium TaxID=33882 RepID=UPI0035C87A38